MSWGYWGIVAGILVLLNVFFFCMDLLYGKRKTPPNEGIPDGHGATRAADSKHAA